MGDAASRRRRSAVPPRILALIGAVLWISTRAAVAAQSLENLWTKEAMGETMAAPDNKESFKQSLLNYVFHASGPVKGMRHHGKIPLVMEKIYDVVANRTNGQKRHQPAFNVDIIRGLEDSWATDRRMQFLFDMGSINASTDDVVGAQFHIFKRRTYHEDVRREHFVRVSLYRILDEGSLYNRNGTVNTVVGAMLLDSVQVSAYTSEWLIFQSTDALLNTAVQWLREPSTNKGFLITATDLHDQHVNGTRIEFVQRYENPHGRQPVFVVYANQGKSAADVSHGRAREDYRHVTKYLNEDTRCVYSYTSPDEYYACAKRRTSRDTRRFYSDEGSNDGGSMDEPSAAGSPRVEPGTARHRRSRGKQSRTPGDDFELQSEQQNCRKESLYVSFDALGWGKWIVAPDGIHASQCNGRCPFPLPKTLASTNHAVLKSVSNFYKPSEVKPPCCVPERLGKMSILYHESDNMVTMRTYDGMIVESCGCR